MRLKEKIDNMTLTAGDVKSYPHTIAEHILAMERRKVHCRDDGSGNRFSIHYKDGEQVEAKESKEVYNKFNGLLADAYESAEGLKKFINALGEEGIPVGVIDLIISLSQGLMNSIAEKRAMKRAMKELGINFTQVDGDDDEEVTIQ